jgi:hypothetical protein
MTRWERVEDYIDNNLAVGGVFNSRAYAAANGLGWHEASEHIQAHLIAQRGAKSRTKYVLKRQPGTRTSTSYWSVGERARDVRLAGLAFSSDVKAKWMVAVEPDIRRIAAINPQAAKRAEKVCDATLDGALKVLEAAVRA